MTKRKISLTSKLSQQLSQLNHWLVDIAQNHQINGQLQLESLRKFHHSLNESSSWFNYEELVDDRLDLTVLEAGKRGPPSKNRQVGDAEMNKVLRNRKSLRAENGVMCFKDTLIPPLHQRSSECYPLETINFSEQQEKY